jgi:two-component system, NarL family, nitrate/nitrite response regulator NarL
MDPLPVLVVSADPLARSGLARLVAGLPELALAGEAGPLQAARVEAGRNPRVILWDLGGAVGGEEAGPRFAELSSPVVALAADAEQAGDALRAGARSVLSRTAAPEVLAGAIACAAHGLLVLDPSLAASFVRAPEPRGGSEPLTPREREVLALLAEGLANKAIAARLGVSEHTAKFHVNAILAKLGVDSRSEAIVRAVRLGLVVL